MGNASGKASSSYKSRNNKKSVHWKSAEKPSQPGKPHVATDALLNEPDVVTIKWDKPLNDGGSPIVGYLVEHRRTGSPHWVRATPGLVTRPELSLSGLEPGWRYQFRVIAHNAAGGSLPSELSEPLTVTFQRTVVTAPRFTDELKDTTALENEQAEFIVKFMGIPIPTVCWYKDGFEIFSSRRTKILTENGQSVLLIHQAALVDEGEIKCTATNKAGHVTTKAHLSVEAPPQVRLPRQYEDGILFEIDELVRLKVSVAGKPNPEIFWTHNGESLENDARYEIVNSDKISSLKVGSAKRSDRGEYQVRAVNKLGEHVASFLVTVADRPQPPTNVRIMSLGKSVTLSWNIPEDDGGCKIGNYIIEYNRLGWNVWLKASTSRKLTATLGELIEGSEYKFRVKAENPYGVSEPSEESETIFIPDPKRGILEPLRSRSQSRDRPPPAFEDIPQLIKRRKKENNPPSVASSKSSLDSSRPTSPQPKQPKIEPVRPIRASKIKTPLITPDPSPIVGRRDRNAMMVDNIYDRSSVTRELSYGSPNLILKKPKLEENFDDRVKSPTELLRPNFTRSRSPSPSPSRDVRILSEEESMKFSEHNTNSNNGRLESPRNEDILHGSSEFMLVILPNENDNSSNNRKRGDSVSNLVFDEISVAPPMSLSAPELGNEPPFLGSLRSAVSSSELLHERAMARFIEAAAAEEAEFEKRRASLQKRSVESLPRIRINSLEKDDAISLERKHSLRRRLSGSGITQQMLWQKRLSLKNADELTDGAENVLLLSRQSPQKSKSPTPEPQNKVESEKESNQTTEININNQSLLPSPPVDRLKPMMVRQRSASEELEEEVFEQVRAKMKQQDSLKSNQLQSMEKRSIEIADEDKWEVESVEPEELEYEESISTEDSEDEEDDRPSLADIVPPEIVHVEEEIYHPKMMIARTVVPTVTEQTFNPSDAPFEILNKPSPLPDPNFVPKPILKRRETNGSVEESIGQVQISNDKKIAPDKPIRKSINQNDKNSGTGFLKNIAGSLGTTKNKEDKPETQTGAKIKMKMPRWAQKAVFVEQHSSAQPVVIKTAAEMAREKQIEDRKRAEEEMRTVIDHYGDIVKEYSQVKKPQTTIFLNRDELKAAAASQQTVNVGESNVKHVDFNKEDKTSNEIQSYKELNNLSSLNEPPKPRPNVFGPRYEPEPDMISPHHEPEPKIFGPRDEPERKIFGPRNEPEPKIFGPRIEPEPKIFGPRIEPEPKIFGPRIESEPKIFGPRYEPEPYKPPQQEKPHILPRRSESPQPFSPRVTENKTYPPYLENQQQAEETMKNNISSTSRRAMASNRTEGRRSRESSLTRKMRRQSPLPDKPPTPEPTLSRSISPEQRPLTPEQQMIVLDAEAKVRSSVDYMTDVAMFFVACWLYLFKNELFAIPVLLLMVYRQLNDEVAKNMPAWMKRTKKP